MNPNQALWEKGDFTKFAPKPFDVAKEMVRVTKPGGRIVLGNWIPGDPTVVSQMLNQLSVYAPPPEGFVSPMTWGVESHIVERFGQAEVPQQKKNGKTVELHSQLVDLAKAQNTSTNGGTSFPATFMRIMVTL